MNIIFLHGYQSSNQGDKAVLLRKIFLEILIPNFTGDLDERMKKLNTILPGKSNLCIIGSSFGGLMAVLYTIAHINDVSRLILLAPALCEPFIPESFDIPPINIPIMIIQGKNDEIVPIQPVKDFAKKFFTNYIYQAVDDDHRLHSTSGRIDWLELVNNNSLKLN